MKALLIAATLANAAIFSGVIFGFSSLQIILEDDGVFSEGCESDDSIDCRPRDLKFNLMYTLATTFLMGGSLLAGFIVDNFGPTVVAFLTTSLITLAFIFIAIAGKEQFSLYLISCIFLGLGGSFSLMNVFPLGFLVDADTQRLIFAAANCLFDGSGIAFFLCYLVAGYGNINRKSLFTGVALLALFICGSITLLWWKLEPELRSKIKQNEANENRNTQSRSTSPCPDVDLELQNLASREISDTNSYNNESIQNDDNINDDDDEMKESNDIYNPLSRQSESDRPTDVCVRDSENIAYTEPMAVNPNIPWYDNLKSFNFLFLVIFSSIQVFRSNIFFGLIGPMLDNYGDIQLDHWYSQIFVAGLPCSFVFIPVIEYTGKRMTLTQSFHMINLFGYAFNILSLIPNLPLQIITFLCFYAFRAYLFSMMAYYCAISFGPVNSGRIFGCMNLVVSIVNLLQYGVYSILNTYSYSYTNLLIVTIVFIILNTVCTILTQRVLGGIQYASLKIESSSPV